MAERRLDQFFVKRMRDKLIRLGLRGPFEIRVSQSSADELRAAQVIIPKDVRLVVYKDMDE